MAQRLDSWKEIAAFLGRGVRTVQRWEREEGLPVHRLEHARRGSVFAYRPELTDWWERRQSSLTREPQSGGAEAMVGATSRRTWVLLSAVVAAATILVLTIGRTISDVPAPPRVDRLTTGAGTTAWPSLSADGRLIAYASDGGKDGSALQIWIQHVGTAQASQLTHCPWSCTDPSFSPDGARVMFSAKDTIAQSLYEVPVTGGQPRLVRRAARSGRWSPNGQWLAFVSETVPRRVHVATADGRVKALATGLMVGDFAVWSPSGRYLLVPARLDVDDEPEWYAVAPDDGAMHNTGVLRWLRGRGFAGRWHTAFPPAWAEETSLVFSDGASLWRQRLTSGVPHPRGEPEQLTRGAPMAWFASAGGGRLAFVSSNPDVNLRSVAVDPHSGVAFGPIRRLTRGPGIVQYPSLSNDGRVLAYSSSRAGNGDVFMRVLGSETETALAHTPAREAYSAVSPSGRRVAYGVVLAEDRPRRPITLANIDDGTSRQICSDCRGRPRAWLDERMLIVERHESTSSSLVLLDVEDGSEEVLIDSRRGPVSNPRVAPDGRSIAFDVQATGHRPEVFVASISGARPVPDAHWVHVAASAKNPFWSETGALLYYVSEEGDIRARRILAGSGTPEGDAFHVFTPSELTLPVWLPGTAPVAASDRLVLVLADLRGDVWLMQIAD